MCSCTVCSQACCRGQTLKRNKTRNWARNARLAASLQRVRTTENDFACRSPLPLTARRFPLALAGSHSLPGSHSPFSPGDSEPESGDWGLFQKATRLYTRATRSTGGDSRGRLGARRSNSPLRLGHQGGASRRGWRRLAAASRPGRGRLAAARCAAPLPRAPPLPRRSLPTLEYSTGSCYNS